LAQDVTEPVLFELFNTVGPVASIRVCRDAMTRRSLGYGYVNFHSVVDAERALDTMNFTNIRGRACRIMWSQRDPALRKSGLGNVFVKNLDKSIDNKTLFDTFSMFGNILSCRVSCGPDGESLGYGHVHYETEEGAQKAIEKVNGMLLSDKKVIVVPFRPKGERGGDKDKFTNVYVKNLPTEFNKDNLDELFGKYGKIVSSVLKMNDQNQCAGFAFVNFETPEEAKNAIESLHETALGDKTLYVCRAQKKNERAKELREKFDKIKQERQKKYAGVNLFIKNLDDSIDDAALREAFIEFGNITSSKVMKDQNDRSRGFGFVCFSTQEEATKAVTDMNGRMLKGKPLYVALAQRKEQRRAQLEAQLQAQRMKIQQAGMPMFQPNGMSFYPPQGLPARGMPYPQMMAPPPQQRQQWRGPNPQQQQGFRNPPQQQQYMAAANGNAPARGQPRPRGGRQGGQGPQQQQGAQQVARQQQQQQPRQQAPRPQQQQTQQQQRQPAAASELLVQDLASAPQEQQKQIIGERLFVLIQQREPVLAGKITGMLLEMDNSELLHLLDSSHALHEKVEEAMQVLKEHEEQEGEDGEEEEEGTEGQN
jgi:polyadenylate-binding protein